MAKSKKTVFFCKECGYESSKWLGQCPGCKEVGTFVEEPMGAKTNNNIRRGLINNKPVTINQVTADDEERITTGFGELDRVLGGGVVPGGLIYVEICQIMARRFYIFQEKNPLSRLSLEQTEWDSFPII